MRRRTLALPLYPQEALPSYISRMAALYGAPTATAFTSWYGANFSRVCNGSLPDIQTMAKVVRHDVEELRCRVLRNSARRVIRFSGSPTPRTLIRWKLDRVCAACLADDIDQGAVRSDLRPYGRLTWAITPLDACPLHRQSLSRLPWIPHLHSDDFYLALRHATEKTPGFLTARQAREPSVLDRYIVARTHGAGREETWLDRWPLLVVLRLSAYVGDTIFDVYPEDSDALVCATRIGFERIRESEENFREVLRQFIIDNYPRRKMTPFAVFGEMATEFCSPYDQPEDAEIRAIMREVACEMLPLKTGEDFFGPVIRQES